MLPSTLPVLPPTSCRRRAWLPLLALALLAQLGLAGNDGCGSKETESKLRSPLQALGTVAAEPDGTVNAELVLISSAGETPVFIDSARDVQLTLDDQTTLPLTKDPARSGRWAVSSRDDARLVLAAGTRYLFRFVVPDAGLAGEHAGEAISALVTAVDAPGVPVATEAAQVNQELQLDVSPPVRDPRRAVVRVYGPDGALTYDNFDLSRPSFSGNLHATLFLGSELKLPGRAFPVAGEYRLVLYTMNYASGFSSQLSSELGVWSGFLAGSGTLLSITVQ